MRKELRKKEIKKRKNFLPTMTAITILWLGLIFLVYFVEPETLGAVPLFFAIFFLASFFSLAILFANSRRGFLASLVFVIFLILRYLGIGNILNFLLLAGVAVAFEVYYTTSIK